MWAPDPSSPSANPRPPMMVSLAPNARDRRRAGAGDHQAAVRAGMRADAGGRRVVRRAHEPKAGKSRRHSRLVAALLEPGEPETSASRSPLNVADARPSPRPRRRPRAWPRPRRQNRHECSPPRRSPRQAPFRRRRAAARGSGWRRRRLRDRAARWSRRFAVFRRSIIVGRGRPKRVRSFGRGEPPCARPLRRLLGRHGQMHEDGGDRRPLRR